MITAVDTNVLLDVFGADPDFGVGSAGAVKAALAQGSLVACEIVWAEAGASFPAAMEAEAAMKRMRIDFHALDVATALLAGEKWGAYRRRGGKRDRVIADFVIGAHALARADRLLTRDRGFYRSYFQDLEVLDPTR